MGNMADGITTTTSTTGGERKPDRLVQTELMLFGVVVLPLTFLGAIYYPWAALGPVKAFGFSWLKVLVLVNPLVYMSEGFRAALTTGVRHMSLAAIYAVLVGFAAVLTWLGIKGFRQRVIS